MATTGNPSAPLTAQGARSRTKVKGLSLGQRIMRDRWMYLFIIPGALYFLVFQYLPLLGNIIAFKDYSPYLGILESPWSGLDSFRRLFTDVDFKTALKNTVVIELLQLVFSFPAPLILALVLNSIFNERIKRTMQSIVYLPYFLSWVVVIALWQQILGGAGVFNQLLRNNGMDIINVMNNPGTFKFLVVAESIWKYAGWGTIIFLAALTKVDTELYEAGAVDGAVGWRRLWHITLPSIRGGDRAAADPAPRSGALHRLRAVLPPARRGWRAGGGGARYVRLLPRDPGGRLGLRHRRRHGARRGRDIARRRCELGRQALRRGGGLLMSITDATQVPAETSPPPSPRSSPSAVVGAGGFWVAAAAGARSGWRNRRSSFRC